MSVDRFQLGDCIPLQELKEATAEQVGPCDVAMTRFGFRPEIQLTNQNSIGLPCQLGRENFKNPGFTSTFMD